MTGAVEQYGADDAFPFDDIGDILPGLLENRKKVYCNVGVYPEFDVNLLNWVNEVKSKSMSGVSAPHEIIDLAHILHELRLIKQTEEINVMKRAARVSSRGPQGGHESLPPR